MKQSFLLELKELEKREKQEKKEKVELYVRSKSSIFRGFLIWIAMIIFALGSIGAVTYAMYLFVDLTKLNDIAGIHLASNIKLAARTIQGNVLNDPEKGINNWILHKDLENGFEIAHPENWIVGKGESHLYEIKKYNSQRSVNESLAAIIYVDKLENINNLSILDFASEETGFEKDIFKKEMVSDREVFRTGKQKESSGLSYSKIFWENNGNNYCLKVVYYNQSSKDIEKDLEKILSELKIKEYEHPL